ncbi:MAG TPA: YbaK/EbsC family protein [Acidimicrobiia bacterium]|nr:YbaK/EbsC family protein [Acidimicrobiia bacterium]
MTDSPALADPRLTRLDHEVTQHGPVASLEEAAAARGVTAGQVVKTMVVRRSADDYLFVLVPGDRTISWPKLRRHLGLNRISMPDADEALAVTGYARGTITPFGSTTDWPVLADASLPEVVSIGGGAHGVAITSDSADLISVLDADVADVTESV